VSYAAGRGGHRAVGQVRRPWDGPVPGVSRPPSGSAGFRGSAISRLPAASAATPDGSLSAALVAAAVTGKPAAAVAGDGVDVAGGHRLPVEAAGAFGYHPDPVPPSLPAWWPVSAIPPRNHLAPVRAGPRFAPHSSRIPRSPIRSGNPPLPAAHNSAIQIRRAGPAPGSHPGAPIP
jgi:hypothetical protein